MSDKVSIKYPSPGEQINGCPLCDVWTREPENLLWEDEAFAIVRTKDLKGHKERAMIVFKQHVENPDHAWTEFALEIVEEQAPVLFPDSYKVVALMGKFGSIPQHFHICFTDLDPNAEDFYQMLGTPWHRVIDVKEWRK